jgi:hypothetical protein
MPHRRLLACLLASCLLPTPLRAQQPARTPAASRLNLAAPRDSAPGLVPAVAVTASLVVPGAGQWLQGNRRWVPYLALEAWSWMRFLERRQESRELAGRYRDLAWQVARRVSLGERRDTMFEYYESLAEYRSSGVWDREPGLDGLQPELDETTFNGQLWALARGLYFPADQDFPPGSPQYEAALAYYRQRAVPQSYAWDWGLSGLERSVFVNLITDSDDAYRDGTRMLGVILANHVASVVDALVTGKLRSIAAGRAEVRSEVLPAAGRTELRTELRVRF